MAAFDRPYMTYYQSAVVTIALSCIIFEIKRDIGRKSRFFRILAFDTPVRGSSPELYCHTVCCGETRMVWLPDRRTDRGTDGHLTTAYIPRYA